MADLAAYAHLWDGSEPGWGLVRIEQASWTVSVHFGESGPDIPQIAALRRVSPQLRNRPAGQVLAELRGKSAVIIATDLGNIESRALVEAAREAGFTVESRAEDRGGTFPRSPDGRVLLIEDDTLARSVVARMLAAGVPIAEVHVD